MINFSRMHFPSRRHQSGGTVLGLIIGLIVGLGIAVVVAVMITKSSLPFTNKQAQPERAVSADAKPPVVDKPVDGAKAAEKAAADAKIAEKAAAKKTDKLDDKIAALTKPDATDEKWIYYLQAGAFREPGDAESAKAKLALMGFEANVSERPSDTGPLYRVRIGPFNQLEVMTRARSKLSDNGVDVAVVRTAR
jgi:cell division protein FtsN